MGETQTTRTIRRSPTARPVQTPAPSTGLVARLTHRPGRAAVMGILNVTPDSFSDGGRYRSRAAAVAHGRRLEADGADLIDVGGESTRPGAEAVPAGEEMRRVVPVIRALRRELSIPISIDTTKADVAEAALDEGARIVNDVSAGRSDPRMFGVVAEARAEIILMHRRGTPKTMQQKPRYSDVVAEVREFLLRRARAAEAAGIPRESIAIDPGIGFGKSLRHNLLILRNLQALASLGYVVVVGASRKSFLGAILDRPAEDRLEGSLAAAILAAVGGARLVRVHDVAGTVLALRVTEAIRGAR